MHVLRRTENVVPYVPEAPAETPAAPAPTPAASFGQLLRGLGHELDRGEALAEHAIHGGSGSGMSPQALIALQAGIYRYSEAVDLVTKVVDRAGQAVKTTLQTT
jgi:hypothetical protein